MYVYVCVLIFVCDPTNMVHAVRAWYNTDQLGLHGVGEALKSPLQVGSSYIHLLSVKL